MNKRYPLIKKNLILTSYVFHNFSKICTFTTICKTRIKDTNFRGLAKILSHSLTQAIPKKLYTESNNWKHGSKSGLGVTLMSLTSKVHVCLIWKPESPLLCHLAERINLKNTSPKQSDPCNFFHNGSIHKNLAIVDSCICSFFNRRMYLWETDFHDKILTRSFSFQPTLTETINKKSLREKMSDPTCLQNGRLE